MSKNAVDSYIFGDGLLASGPRVPFKDLQQALADRLGDVARDYGFITAELKQALADQKAQKAFDSAAGLLGNLYPKILTFIQGQRDKLVTKYGPDLAGVILASAVRNYDTSKQLVRNISTGSRQIPQLLCAAPLLALTDTILQSVPSGPVREAASSLSQVLRQVPGLNSVAGSHGAGKAAHQFGATSSAPIRVPAGLVTQQGRRLADDVAMQFRGFLEPQQESLQRALMPLAAALAERSKAIGAVQNYAESLAQFTTVDGYVTTYLGSSTRDRAEMLADLKRAKEG